MGMVKRTSYVTGIGFPQMHMIWHLATCSELSRPPKWTYPPYLLFNVVICGLYDLNIFHFEDGIHGSVGRVVPMSPEWSSSRGLAAGVRTCSSLSRSLGDIDLKCAEDGRKTRRRRSRSSSTDRPVSWENWRWDVMFRTERDWERKAQVFSIHF